MLTQPGPAVYDRKGDLEKAIADYSEAPPASTRGAARDEERGYDYAKTRKFDQAIADLTVTLRLNPNPGATIYGASGRRLRAERGGGKGHRGLH